MKYLGYVLRNALRNKLRSGLTIASITISLVLMMMLGAFLAVQEQAIEGIKKYNRVVVMGAQGFAQPIPIGMMDKLEARPGVAAVNNWSWFGGKYENESVPFAQFATKAETFFEVFKEYECPDDQKRAWIEDRQGALIGYKLASDRGIKIGDKMPIEGELYPFNLDLTVRAIYKSPDAGANRTLLFHWDYLNEEVKKLPAGEQSADNAGIINLSMSDPAVIPELCRAIDADNLNSDTPTKSQTEAAFGAMFTEFLGDVPAVIRMVGGATVFSLLCVAGCAMALAMRERTTEVAVLKAIGFSRPLVLGLVLMESVVIAGIGGVIGALGSKVLFDSFDLSSVPGAGAFLAEFFIPWPIALAGLGLALTIGLISGAVPAWNAARLSVVDGLRKVV